MNDNYQRVGSTSNAHVGRAFEQAAIRLLGEAGIHVSQNYSVEVGVAETLKAHKFDGGSSSPPVLLECKSHRWTKGGKVPSAKMATWNEAMYYFSCAPSHYRKILFVLRDLRSTNMEPLSSYYLRTYKHFIPPGVEIWELDEELGTCSRVLGE
jgi:hypothetical protein